MKLTKIIVLLAGISLLAGGCVSRAIKEGVGTVTGAKGVYKEVRSPGAFGPLEEAVCEVQLVDKASGEVIGNATCVGRSTATVNQGLDKKAQGLAKAIVDWIKSNRPEDDD